jgi:hypothetical protein
MQSLNEALGMTPLSWGLMCGIIVLAALMWGRKLINRKPSPDGYWSSKVDGWLPAEISNTIPRGVGNDFIARTSIVLDYMWPQIVSVYNTAIQEHPDHDKHETWSKPSIQKLIVKNEPLPEGHTDTMYHPQAHLWTMRVGCKRRLIAGELHSIMRSMLNVYDAPDRYRPEALQIQNMIQTIYKD